MIILRLFSLSKPRTMQSTKLNRPCKLLIINGLHYIVMTSELKDKDYYIWENNNQLCQCVKNSKDISRLNTFMSNKQLFKIIATDDKGMKLLNIPPKFISDIKKGFITQVDLDKLTIKFTYDLPQGIQAMYAPRSNYRPKIVRNTIKLNIFEHRSKKY